MRSSVLVIVAALAGCGEPLHARTACDEEVAAYCTEALVSVTCSGLTAYALCEGQLVPILDPLLLQQIASNACYDDVPVVAGAGVSTPPASAPPVRNVWVRFADGVRIRPGSPGSPQTVDPGPRPQPVWAPTRAFTVHGTAGAPTTASAPPSTPPKPTSHPPVVDTAAPSHATSATTYSHSSPVITHPTPSPPSHPAPTVSHPTTSTTSHPSSTATTTSHPSATPSPPSHPTTTTTSAPAASPTKHR